MTRQWLAGLGLLAAGLVAGWSAARSQAPPGDKPDPAPARDRAADRGRPLDTLDWMVGDWLDDDDQVTAEFSCHFTKNDAFLVRSFRIITKDDVRLSGMQVIAWNRTKRTDANATTVELDELVEGRNLIAPVLATVERPVVPAVVEADPRVVLAGDDVPLVPRVDLDRLLSLTTQRTVLVDPRVGHPVAVEHVLAALGLRT